MTLDAAATEARRRALADARIYLTAYEVEDALYQPGGVSKRRVCPLNPADAAGLDLSANDLVELVGPGNAPLRAWVAIDDRVKDGAVPVDAIARQVLKASAGERVEIRPIRPAEVL